MATGRESLVCDWEGLAAAASDMPMAVFLGVVVTIVHTAAFIPWESVRSHLKDVLGGNIRERKVFRGVRMEWRGKQPLTATVKRGRITLVMDGRTTGTRLRKTLAALEAIPNTGRVRLKAQLERTPADGASTGRPSWMDSAARFR